MNKRILVFNIEISGVNKYLFSQLKKRGWDINIIDVPIPKICMFLSFIYSFSPNIFQWERNIKEKIGIFLKLPWSFIQRSRFCQKKIKELNGNFDIILQISGTFAPTLKYKNLKIPYVTFNDYTMALASKYPDATTPYFNIKRWLNLEGELYRNARFVFVASENTKKSMILDYGVPSQKVITLRYGLPLNITPKLDKTYDKKIILFVGRSKSFKQKGGFVLLKAFEKILEEIKDAELIIVGVDKDFLKIKQPSVKPLGYIKNRDIINELYDNASVFVMPSFSEAFGLVFLEAMSHKLPCIGTNIDAIPEIIENDVTGFLVPPGDVDLLSEKIITLLKNPELCKKMGLLGYKKLNEEFSWEKFGEELDLYLKKCID